MARLFTINIPFQNQSYQAIVTLRSHGNETSCFVRYSDKSISDLIPGGALLFKLSEGSRLPFALADQQAKELVHSTTEAITHYLEED